MHSNRANGLVVTVDVAEFEADELIVDVKVVVGESDTVEVWLDDTVDVPESECVEEAVEV